MAQYHYQTLVVWAVWARLILYPSVLGHYNKNAPLWLFTKSTILNDGLHFSPIRSCRIHKYKKKKKKHETCLCLQRAGSLKFCHVLCVLSSPLRDKGFSCHWHIETRPDRWTCLGASGDTSSVTRVKHFQFCGFLKMNRWAGEECWWQGVL